MQAENASRTALATAYLRAAHQILDPAPRVLDDTVASRLLGRETENEIRASADNFMLPGAKALRSHVVLRSRFAEDQLESAIERGICQYVLVGAGFDTFALRQPHWASGLKVVEVDHPATQRLKQSKIADAGISVPGNVVFAGIDFEQESLEQGLARVGVDLRQRTFFSWLGVTVYLTEVAIDATLRCMAAYPRGSEAVITFRQSPDVQSGAGDELAEHVSALGEPFVSYFTPERFREKLLAHGFSEVHFLTPQLSAPLFAEGPGSLPNPNRVSVVSAIV
jgi:methyltransferase (TIGR00027 family)